MIAEAWRFVIPSVTCLLYTRFATYLEEEGDVLAYSVWSIFATKFRQANGARAKDKVIYFWNQLAAILEVWNTEGCSVLK